MKGYFFKTFCVFFISSKGLSPPPFLCFLSLAASCFGLNEASLQTSAKSWFQLPLCPPCWPWAQLCGLAVEKSVYVFALQRNHISEKSNACTDSKPQMYIKRQHFPVRSLSSHKNNRKKKPNGNVAYLSKFCITVKKNLHLIPSFLFLCVYYWILQTQEEHYICFPIEINSFLYICICVLKQ